MPDIEHLFCVCQFGAEQALKEEVAVRAPGLRLGFSRPGFVTFKLPKPVALAELNLPRLLFARTQGASLGKVAGEDQLSSLTTLAWRLPEVTGLVKTTAPLKLHVWQRDANRPGEHGFEPGPTPLSETAFAAVSAAAPAGALLGDHSAPGAKGPTVALDIAMVEPNEWWIGCHRLKTRVDRWPGGTPPIVLPDHAVSRAYLKMREALAWAHLPASKGDQWIELGCAPGGASQALLDLGMRVIGVDPAEVDPVVSANPGFRSMRMRAAEAKKTEFTAARWLAADINAAPNYTLDAVESVVTSAETSLRGLILTLKLPEWSLAAPPRIQEYFERIKSWGYRDLRGRQLAFNRREICVAALRSRGQRRVRRR